MGNQGIETEQTSPEPGHTLLYFHTLTIKLGHLLTEFHLPQDSPELGLVNAGEEPAVGIGEGLAERRLQDLSEHKGESKGEKVLRGFKPETLVSSYTKHHLPLNPRGQAAENTILPWRLLPIYLPLFHSTVQLSGNLIPSFIYYKSTW